MDHCSAYGALTHSSIALPLGLRRSTQQSRSGGIKTLTPSNQHSQNMNVEWCSQRRRHYDWVKHLCMIWTFLWLVLILTIIYTVTDPHIVTYNQTLQMNLRLLIYSDFIVICRKWNTMPVSVPGWTHFSGNAFKNRALNPTSRNLFSEINYCMFHCPHSMWP